MKRGIFLFCISFSICIQSSFAQDSLSLSSGISSYTLDRQWSYYEDKSRLLTWNQALEYYQNDNFTKDLEQLSFFQVSSSAHWLTIKVYNPSQEEKNFTLNIKDPNILEVDFFQVGMQDTLIAHQINGTKVPPGQRSLGVLSPAFAFRVPAGESHVLLLRLYSTNYLSIKTSLSPVDNYLKNQVNKDFFLGLFYGVVCLILVYHFIFFIYTGEWAFIYLLAYHFFFGLITGLFDGFTSTYFYIIYPLTYFQPEVPLVVGIVISSQISMRSFLRIPKYLPVYDRVIKVFIAFSLLVLVLGVIYPQQTLLSIPPFILCSIAIILWVSYQAYTQKSVRASYFFASFLFFACIVLFILINLLSLVPISSLLINMIYFGYMGQMLILSVGFAVELRGIIQDYIEQAKDREATLKLKNQELEDKVAERTKNLFTSTNQLKSVIESTNDVIYSINREGEFLVVNSAARNRAKNVYGTEMELGQNLFEKLPEKLKPIFEPLLERVWQGEPAKTVKKIEYGDIVLVQELSINPIFGENGEVTGAAIFSKDLTELVQRTNQLAQTNASLRSILDNNDSAIWLVNREFTLIDMNHTAEKIYKLTNQKKPIIGENALNFLSPAQKQTWSERYRKVLDGGQSQMYMEHHQYDNQTVDFLVKIFPVYSNKEITGLSIFLNNITEQHRAEKALRENQKLLMSINQHLSEGIYRSNNNKVVYANQAFADMFGYTLEEVLENKAITYYVKPTIREKLLKVLEVEGAYQNQEVEFKRKDGSKFWSLISSTRYVDENGDIFFDGVIRDISALKQAEDELLAKNKSLLKINKELDKFVYSASHDLRAPLTSLLGLIQITQEEPNEEVRKQYFELMIKSIKRLDQFIRQIVDYSRNSRVEVKPEKVDFKILTEQVFQSIEYLDHAINIQKNASIDQTHEFYTDVFRLEVILNNLVSNAIKYANPYQEHPRLDIKVQVFAEEAIIEVQDNGQGIEAEYLGNIFEMFYKANTQNKGSGLGLYIVRETVEVMKGKIEVNSEFGIGTTFKLKIPNMKNDKARKTKYEKSLTTPK